MAQRQSLIQEQEGSQLLEQLRRHRDSKLVRRQLGEHLVLAARAGELAPGLVAEMAHKLIQLHHSTNRWLRHCPLHLHSHLAVSFKCGIWDAQDDGRACGYSRLFIKQVNSYQCIKGQIITALLDLPFYIRHLTVAQKYRAEIH